MTQKFELIVDNLVLINSLHTVYGGHKLWKMRHHIVSHELNRDDPSDSTITFEDEQSRTNFILSFC